MEKREFLEKTRSVLLVFLFVYTLVYVVGCCCSLASEYKTEKNIVHIRNINGYELIQLEDGHQYLRVKGFCSDKLDHYVDCEKCKKNKK